MKTYQSDSDQQRVISRPFEFQNWPIYKEMLSVSKRLHQICAALPNDGRRGLVDQLIRASQSVCLNVAEGSARSTAKDKVNFLRMAKGSLFECVAVLDLFGELELIGPVEREELQERLARVGKMVSGLIRFIETGKKDHQSAYGAKS